MNMLADPGRARTARLRDHPSAYSKLAEAKQAQNGQDNNDCADQPNDAVHEKPLSDQTISER